MIRAHHRARHVSSVSHWASGSPRCPPYAAPLAVAIFCSPPHQSRLSSSPSILSPCLALPHSPPFHFSFFSPTFVLPLVRANAHPSFRWTYQPGFVHASSHGPPSAGRRHTRHLDPAILSATISRRSLDFLTFYHRHPTPRHDGLGVHQGDACLAPRQRGRMGARHCHLGSDTWRSKPRL